MQKMLSKIGKSCPESELVKVEKLWQEIESFDFVQVVHLREKYMIELVEKLAESPYDAVEFPTAKKYPTFVISPHLTSGKISN